MPGRLDFMGRPPRADEGGLVYHASNRSNARMVLFECDEDYEAFLRVLAQAQGREPVELFAFCVLPDQFQLVLRPRDDGGLSRFLRWLTLTHTQRWHARHGSAGSGHVYQGRFKSFPVQDDAHFATACRYVERNPLNAGLVARAEDWRWGSLRRDVPAGDPSFPALSPWPIPRPKDWLKRVNTPIGPAEEQAMARSLGRGQPLGDPEWTRDMAARLGLEATIRPRGRPRKAAGEGA
ncbi:MAG: transposase [Isosphaeraceae bacterium]